MIQSLVVSLVVHIVFIAGAVTIGYIKTKNHIPELENKWDKVEVLQQKVAFGVVGSPLYLIFTFLGVALIIGMIITSYKKMQRTNRG
ncbi:hypothetical protein [Paenibacillus sp. YPG26]|uniref:hypothetical protein n=1 Tax=Paenibacillus sp. YPG26 TaxID=2878915 RepID=UPI00203B3333|nr:hypothetical protein [Paenibacillus sp. YPG26]USB35091.1 hypothetical protein LDO05_12275 [Paenibacillus sp. YPG26]